jgi:hypothetical protein
VKNSRGLAPVVDIRNQARYITRVPFPDSQPKDAEMKRGAIRLKPVVVVFTLVLTSVIAFQCIEAPLAPIGPTSDISLSIPLADVTKYASEFFNDTATVKRAGDGSLFFTQTNTSPPTKIDTIRIDAEPSSQTVAVGKVEVPGVPLSTQSVTLSDMGLDTLTYPGEDAIAPGFPPPFPVQNLTLDPVDLAMTSQFDFLAIDTGSITLTFTNNLPLRMGFTKPVVLINDTATFDTVASFSLGNIDSFQTVSATSDLAQKIMFGKLKTDSIRFTTQSRSTPFSLKPYHGVSFGFGSSALRVDSGRAVIPQQTLAAINDSVIKIDDSISVKSATFRSGRFDVKFTNSLGINVGVFMKFNNFVSTAVQDTFTISRLISGHTVTTIGVAMDTLRLINGTPADVGTSMRFSVGISTVNSAGAKSSISKNDLVRAEFLPQELFAIKSITGKIKPTKVPIFTGVVGPDLGALERTFQGHFTFDSAQIAVNLGLTGGFPTGYNLKFIAKNTKANKLDTLPVPGNLFDPGPNGNQITTIILDKSNGLNGFLDKFYPNFPDSFFVVGSATVNEGFVERTIADSAKLTTSLKVFFPLKIGLLEGKVVTASAIDGKSFPKDVTVNVKTASVNFQFTNHLPFQMAFTMRLVGDTGAVGRDTLLVINPGSVAAALIDGTGSVSDSVISNIAVRLTGAQMAMFNLADSTLMEFNMQSSNGGTQPVKIRVNVGNDRGDFIRVRASGKMVYTIKGN